MQEWLAVTRKTQALRVTYEPTKIPWWRPEVSIRFRVQRNFRTVTASRYSNEHKLWTGLLRRPVWMWGAEEFSHMTSAVCARRISDHEVWVSIETKSCVLSCSAHRVCLTGRDNFAHCFTCFRGGLHARVWWAQSHDTVGSGSLQVLWSCPRKNLCRRAWGFSVCSNFSRRWLFVCGSLATSCRSECAKVAGSSTNELQLIVLISCCSTIWVWALRNAGLSLWGFRITGWHVLSAHDTHD